MGLYEHWPYVNFHDLNLDWIIKEIPKVFVSRDEAQASAEASAESAAASHLSAEASQASADASQLSAEAAQQSASDSQESAEASAASEVSAKNYADHIADPVSGLVTEWLEDNITPTTPAVDASLTVSGAAADAKVTGDKINAINNKCYAFNLVPGVYINRDNGNELSSSGWSATDYIPIPPNTLMIYTGSASLVWGAMYDENKNYLSPRTWNTQFNSFFNDTNEMRYFRTSGEDANMKPDLFKSFPVVDPTFALNGYPANSKSVGDALNAIDQRIEKIESDVYTVPAYYVSQLQTKEANIRYNEKNCSLNGDSLVFLTDTHFTHDLFSSDTPSTTYNANNSFSLIMDIVKKCGINKIVFGGDLVNSAPNVDTMLLCMSSFRSKWKEYNYNLRYCVGNHEYYTGSDLGLTLKPTPGELYGAGIKYDEPVIKAFGDMDTYYFDNDIQKIRYFVISCGRDTETTPTQIEWILNEFRSIPDDYKVICIGHGFLSDNMQTFRGGYKPIADALDAVKSGGSYTYNDHSYNYAPLNNVTVVCMITGHTHIDGSLVTAGGIPCICTTTDSYALNYELVNNTPTLTPRTIGTVNEQAFDVFQFNFTDRKIYTTRIGYGSNREFNY